MRLSRKKHLRRGWSLESHKGPFCYFQKDDWTTTHQTVNSAPTGDDVVLSMNTLNTRSRIENLISEYFHEDALQYDTLMNHDERSRHQLMPPETVIFIVLIRCCQTILCLECDNLFQLRWISCVLWRTFRPRPATTRTLLLPCPRPYTYRRIPITLVKEILLIRNIVYIINNFDWVSLSLCQSRRAATCFDLGPYEGYEGASWSLF